jgi:hypothetical protein
MAHRAVQHRGLRRGQASADKQQSGFLPPAPVAQQFQQFRNAGGTAAAERAGEAVEQVALGGFHRGGGQVLEAGSSDMRGECCGGIGHRGVSGAMAASVAQGSPRLKDGSELCGSV